MFGFSLVGLFITFFGTLSAISTFIILACCFVSGKSSRTEDAAFRAYLLQKQTLANFADTSFADVSHRNYSATVPNTAAEAEHRSPLQADKAQAGKAVKQVNQATNNEKSASIVKE